MRFITLLLALALGTMSLSAQENIITPAPVRVQGGICVDDYCAPAEPFDFRQTLNLNISGADSADAERLEAAVSAAGLNFKRVKAHRRYYGKERCWCFLRLAVCAPDGRGG